MTSLIDPTPPADEWRTQPPSRAVCTGGQGTEPNEQNTQQSPRFGRSVAPQSRQS